MEICQAVLNRVDWDFSEIGKGVILGVGQKEEKGGHREES